MADSLIYQTEKTLTDLEDKVPADTKTEVEEKIVELKTALEGEDIGEIQTKTEELTQAGFKLGEIAYQQAQAEAEAAGTDGAEAEAAGDDDEVVEGDFEVVDDE
jgi:molecular chaperone DnaK